ncbi:MAG TPA: ABC transporter ATP-binding protein [Bryobacteraceae bacterium]|nr:ABC transporter ATP-binding protein [Bryobacteraceae bacterium]
MLEVRGLTKRYHGFTAVDDVSFCARPGEILGYLGPNGAGKSTTVKILIGLLDPSEGQVLWNGRSVREDLPEFQRRLGYVPEEPNLYPFLTGREYLQLAGRLRGMPRAVLEPKIDAFLGLFSLWDDRDAPVTSYSKGMRQKILLSAGLLHNPDILILDEPMSGLDVSAVLVVRDLLQKLAAQGKTILFSSHVLEVVERVCSRVVILNRGRVAADDSVVRLRELMRLPSLEAIFAELTEERDPASVADRIMEAMQ